MYVSSSAPIPQNSAIAPPPDAGLDARRMANALYSRYGRERVYATLPTPASLAYLGLGLAVDAAGAIANSEPARQAVLIGVGSSSSDDLLAGGNGSSGTAATLESWQDLRSQAPLVYSLNGSSALAPAGGIANPAVSTNAGGSTMTPTMPQRAPIPAGGVYMNSGPPKGPVSAAPRSVTRAQLAPPGCGMSGYPPPWGNAYVAIPPGAGQGNGNGVLGWIQANPLTALGVGISVALGIAQMQKKGRR